MVYILLILGNLATLGLYIALHKRLTLLSKELVKVTNETGYSLWKLEYEMKYRED